MRQADFGTALHADAALQLHHVLAQLRLARQHFRGRIPIGPFLLAIDQLHHFVAAGLWDAAPLEKELLVQADKLVGGSDAVLVIDDTAVPKKGKHSVGVASQYASALGKNANRQTLVSLTLARDEDPVPCAHDDDRLRLPPIPSPQTSEAGKKELTDHRLDQACRPSVTPSWRSSPDRHRSDAHTAENRSARARSVNNAKVVLGCVHPQLAAEEKWGYRGVGGPT